MDDLENPNELEKLIVHNLAIGPLEWWKCYKCGRKFLVYTEFENHIHKLNDELRKEGKMKKLLKILDGFLSLFRPKKAIKQILNELAQDIENGCSVTNANQGTRLPVESLKSVWNEERGCMSNFISVVKETDPKLVEPVLQKLNLAEINRVLSVHFSGSGSGKYRIIKDNEVVATLFAYGKNHQAEYTIPFDVKSTTNLILEFTNMDLARFDVYASVQVEKKKSTKRKVKK